MLTVTSSRTSASKRQFWFAVVLWQHKPHTINRRLCGSDICYVGHTESKQWISSFQISELHGKTTSQVVDYLACKGLSPRDVSTLSEIYTEENSPGVYVVVKQLFPRNTKKFKTCLELSILDVHNGSVTVSCINHESDDGAILLPRYMYQICYNDHTLTLSVENGDACNQTSTIWLRDQLLQKIQKWSETTELDTGLSSSTAPTSLSLVSVARYNELYNNLKEKYSENIIKVWPEVTDPQKFVYEDIAIATYLLLLWEEERLQNGLMKKQSFVDLGCGNGLLVYILSEEGHPGLGLDVRKRKIWNLYPPSTKLEVRTITPCAESLFPEVDWIIGNHTDELTPWVPVISARSSPSCQFFLLPCCTYDFDGNKYQRKDSSLTQYEDYMQYVKLICDTCGFDTKRDRLKIPSTKRICYVGFRRPLSQENAKQLDENITEFILSRVPNNNIEGIWCSFKARNNVETVRNCTQLDRQLCENIVQLVSKILLQKSEKLESEDDSWNAGGTIELKELADMLPSDKLKSLKKEFGGLQTLLKNNHYVFCVNGGVVRHRDPRFEPTKVKSKLKRPCWFYNNYPHGCPLSEELCKYSH